MEKMNDLKDLLKHELMDIASAEQQIIESLPAMIEKASSDQLKNALSDHLRVTEQQKSRLEKVQQLLNGGNKKEEDEGLLSRLFKSNVRCRAMKGILEEGEKMMGEDMSPEVMDAAIVACAQKVEHYEITSYGTVRTWARELGLEQVARLLEETLNEEYHADDLLTMIAESRINKEAENNAGSSGNKRNLALGPSATGSATQSTKERAGRRVEELEPVSNTRTNAASSKRSTTPASGKSSPAKGSTSRSSSTGARSASKTAGASGGAATTGRTIGGKSGSKTSGRTSSGGRGSGNASGRNKSR